jgi:ankyrin repeat protein
MDYLKKFFEVCFGIFGAVQNTVDKSSKQFFECLEKGDLTKVETLVKKYPELLQKKDKDGYPPLQSAIYFGHTQMVKILIENGADLAGTNNKNSTALHMAVELGKVDAVQLLIENNAPLDAQDNKGSTPLHVAVFGKKLDLIKMLVEAKANINATDNVGMAPIKYAIMAKDEKLTKLLEELGAKK